MARGPLEPGAGHLGPLPLRGADGQVAAACPLPSRTDPNAEAVYLRWSGILQDWIACYPYDTGAILFKREPAR